MWAVNFSYRCRLLDRYPFFRREKKEVRKEVLILVAEEDEGRFSVISRTLQRAGLRNDIVRLADGQEVLDFLSIDGDGRKRKAGKEYILFLNTDIGKVDGVTVLEKIKGDKDLKKIPVIMLTRTIRSAEIT